MPLFSRLDAFLERCHDVLDFAQTVVQFTKLGRIEVGGTKGKALTASVEAIFADFNGAVEKFRGVATRFWTSTSRSSKVTSRPSGRPSRN